MNQKKIGKFIQERRSESISYMSVEIIKKLLDDGLMNNGHYKVLEKGLEYKNNM